MTMARVIKLIYFLCTSIVFCCLLIALFTVFETVMRFIKRYHKRN